MINFVSLKAVQRLTALAVISGAHCFATVVNFDNLAVPVALTNQYASQGVMFTQIEATNQFATSVVAVSTPNYATPFYNNTNPGTLFFVDPANSSVAAFTDNVTITLDGYNALAGGWFSGATIDALDLSNSVIPGLTQVIAPTNGVSYGTHSITFTGQIHAVRFTNILNSNGFNGIFPFDDVIFGTLTDAPEPSTWLMVGSVMIAAGLARKRRNA